MIFVTICTILSFLSQMSIYASYVSDYALPGDSNQLSEYEVSIEETETQKFPRLSFQGRYKGILGLGLVELGVFKQMSVGLGFGQFNGENANTKGKGIIPDLYHVHLETSYYLNEQQRYLQTGPVLRMAIHGSYLDSNSYVYSVSVDGKEVVTRDNLQIGPSFTLAYFWTYHWLNASVGLEYFSLGPLKTFIPFSLSLGVAF